ncbi:MAG: hypothetical protein Q9197_002952 [Variospora fuerteventurae]
MRFGRNLHRYHVVEWAPFYIDYQVLKQRYQAAQRLAVDLGKAPDLTDFRAFLHQELSKAKSFYERKHGTLQQSVKTLFELHPIDRDLDLHLPSALEVEDLQATIVEWRDSFKQLLWFWVVNFDKTIPSLAKFETYLAASTNDLALRTRSIDELCRLENTLNTLSKVKSQIDAGPPTQVTSTLPKQPTETLLSHLALKAFGAPLPQFRLTLELFVAKKAFETPISVGLGRAYPVKPLLRQSHYRHTDSEIYLGTDATIPKVEANAIVGRLARVVARLGLLRKSFQFKDRLGRLPLHYAVEYGLLPVCQEILKQMREDRAEQYIATASPPFIPDSEGLTPMDLAVLHGNLEIVNMLLDDGDRRIRDARTNGPHFPQSELLPGNLLMTAIELQYFPVFQLLHRSGIDVRYADRQSNTALHLAVRSRKEQYLTEILHHRSHDQTLNLDARESVYGRTPLIMASENGDHSLVYMLLQAGADPTIEDNLGWRAKDYAAFRGWLPIAKELSQLAAGQLEKGDEVNSIEQQRRHNVKSELSINFAERLKRQQSADECEVFVNLGALDTYKPVLGVDLGPYVKPAPYTPQREADYTVEVRAINGDQTRHLVQLPVLEDRANKPWRFVTKDPEDFKLAFTIYHSTTSAQKGDSPIVTPFPHPDPRKVIQRELPCLGEDGLPIIGHRGMGQNDPGGRHLQLGENTIESFKSAKASGASYVEFDVQLTKDDVPIIYHDFLMSETGIDAPLHNLNLEQFMFISQAQSPEGDPSSQAERNYLGRNSDSSIVAKYRQRSYSLDTHEQAKARELIERMQHTFEYKLNEHKGFDSYKGNIRSKYIQASFATLEELFTKLPESIRFDIEIKYPMLFEAHDWKMETFAVEVNHLVDNVLDRVYRLANDRTMFFSSFSPEVCILLSRKQRVYPVYFLTESGHIPSSDARADSLREAIWFAKSWRLAGVISRSQPLAVSPQLIGCVQDAGLVCISWGELNDDPKQAKEQAKAGLDAIITNSVREIAQTLKER